MRLTTLSPSRVDCMEILGVSISCSQPDMNRPEQGLPYLLPYATKTKKKLKQNSAHSTTFICTLYSFTVLFVTNMHKTFWSKHQK
jgi:hypothetical protein